MKLRLYLGVTAIFFSGCGGGSGNDDQANTQASISPQCLPAVKKYDQETAQNAGIYRGYLEIEATDSAEEGYAILSPSGRLAVIAANGIVTGYFSDGTVVSGNIDLWGSETQFENYTLNGVFSAGDQIQGYNLGAFDYRFEAQYQKPIEDICLASVDATGSWTQTVDGQTTTLTINEDNEFTGSDSSGCVIEGGLSDPSVEGGVFEINATVSNCPKNGLYEGVGAILGTKPETAGQILGVIWSQERHIGFALER